MSISIYKPNKSVKGFAMSLQYQASDKNKEDCVFAQFIKQSTWDEARHIGGFKESMEDPTKKVTVKLEFVELGAILDCLDRNRPLKTVHDDGRGTKSISFLPWMDAPAASLDDKPAGPPVLKGYSFGVTINNKEDPANANKFFIGLTLPEGRYIREFLIWAMQQHFEKTTYQNHLKAPAKSENSQENAIKHMDVREEKIKETERAKIADPLVDF